MEFKNELRPAARDGKIGKAVWNEAVQAMLVLMAPLTPHIAEELWVNCLGLPYSIHNQQWPHYDAAKAKEDTTVLVVQVGKRVVDRIDVPADIAEAQAIALALAGSGVQRVLNGSEPRKVIFIPGRNGQEPKVNIVQ
jgi:leucyl-tRNA synthetase